MLFQDSRLLAHIAATSTELQDSASQMEKLLEMKKKNYMGIHSKEADKTIVDTLAGFCCHTKILLD